MHSSANIHFDLRSYLLVWHGIRANPTIGIFSCGVTPSTLLSQFLIIVFAAPTYWYTVILHFFALHSSDICSSCSSWRFCNPVVPETLQIAAPSAFLQRSHSKIFVWPFGLLHSPYLSPHPFPLSAISLKNTPFPFSYPSLPHAPYSPTIHLLSAHNPHSTPYRYSIQHTQRSIYRPSSATSHPIYFI